MQISSDTPTETLSEAYTKKLQMHNPILVLLKVYRLLMDSLSHSVAPGGQGSRSLVHILS